MAYEFHYTPTGTGAISGKEVLEQTEDAINDLGNTAISGVQEAVDKAEQALTNSANAVDDAQTALNTANNAEGVAIQAQNDVSNLSGTVTNIGNRVTTAEGNIGNLQGRMTTAEGNIGNLQGRMTTAEGNIGNLQTAVSTAQATANSAQQTATTARQQSFVFRYSSTALVASSTNSNTLLDNTDNLKVGDKVIDSDGVLFSITAIDTVNSTFTVGSALIDLALDANVVHTNRNDDVSIPLNSTSAELGVTGGSTDITFLDKNNKKLSGLTLGNYGSSKLSYVRLSIFGKDTNDNEVQDNLEYAYVLNNSNAYLRVGRDNFCNLGSISARWKGVYAQSYYYGSNNVEFSTKFVTTDTAQTISGNKTFSSDLSISNTDTTANTPNLSLRNYSADRGTTDTAVQTIGFLDKNAKALTLLESRRLSNGNTSTNILCYNTDANNDTVSGGVSVIKTKTATNFAPTTDNAVTCGRALAKWSDVQTYKVNALEPSSLSLPSDRSARVDISSYFIYTGNNATNDYSVSTNGYIFLKLNNINQITCYSTDSSSITNYAQTYTRPSDGVLYITFPVRKNDNFRTIWNTGSSVSIESAYFIPCQGNV